MWIPRREWDERLRLLTKYEVESTVNLQMLHAEQVAHSDTKARNTSLQEAYRAARLRIGKLEGHIIKLQDAVNKANAALAAKAKEPAQEIITINLDEDLSEDEAQVAEFRKYIQDNGSSDGLLAAEVRNGV